MRGLKMICGAMAILTALQVCPFAAHAQENQVHEIPQFFQTDYPDVRYGSGSIATSGCSVTSLAMVASYLTGHTYMPDELADYFSTYNSINHIDKLEHMSDMLQLPWKRAENFHVALDALKEGKIIIALMESTSLFTTGHISSSGQGSMKTEKSWFRIPMKPTIPSGI